MLQGVELQSSKPVTLSDFDKPLLVHFWATWCKICELEHSSIKSIANNYPVLTIAGQSGTNAEVKRFLQERQLDFPVILDAEGKFFESWGGVAYPTSFIVNKNLEVEFVEVGFTTELGLRARLFLAKYF